MANPAEIKKILNKVRDKLAFIAYISKWKGGNGVLYHQVFSYENDCVYLIEIEEDRKRDMSALLIYHCDCEVYDASDRLVGTFFVKDDHWHYRDLLINPTQETRCLHVKGAESLLESELLFSKHWLENHQKVKHDEKDNE